MWLMFCVACGVNQTSSDSQDLGRYLGFRLRCLDVDASAPHRPLSKPVPPPVDTPRPPQSPLDAVPVDGASPVQSPGAESVVRGPAEACGDGGSPVVGQRQDTTSSRATLRRQDADAASRCNIIVNSWTEDSGHVIFDH